MDGTVTSVDGEGMTSAGFTSSDTVLEGWTDTPLGATGSNCEAIAITSTTHTTPSPAMVRRFFVLSVSFI
jgi:hypothetical protein